MPQTPTLELVKPQEYFRSKVSSAADSLKVSLKSQVEFYLVNLLCDFIAPPREPADAADVLDTPLALMLKRAMEATADTQIKLFKRLGDTSLYFAGYFQDYFNRKTYDIGYYISMGTTAYESAANVIRYRNGEDQFAEMYKDLAQEFVKLVDIVAQVSEDQIDRRENHNLLAIYERWTHTNSERLRRILHEEGIIPVPNPIRKAQ